MGQDFEVGAEAVLQRPVRQDQQNDLISSAPQRPRCLVLDLRMPNMSGFEIQQVLSQSGNVVPVVIITGDDSPGSRERALVQGARAYLRKPVDETMLLDAIDSAIHSSPAP